ncbi:hypothetical protein SCP_1801570 [Sparassis crispa]|uniref:Uncharacterized protein n=1 Tax=Sparassis crispa TaxID=139825 RepID=A0A401H6X5_9APHY|nr:hypothetical protein SCP_1801570 [Sparassis crispa]GBE90133.1 hypothetical protein SCP_1801570 [Sparassis crispa]
MTIREHTVEYFFIPTPVQSKAFTVARRESYGTANISLPGSPGGRNIFTNVGVDTQFPSFLRRVVAVGPRHRALHERLRILERILRGFMRVDDVLIRVELPVAVAARRREGGAEERAQKRANPVLRTRSEAGIERGAR